MTAATGDVAYTGVGFSPRGATITSYLGNGSVITGFDDGTLHYSAGLYYNTAGHWYDTFDFTKSILIYYSNASGNQVGYIKSWDADGFTIAWTKSGTPTGTADIFLSLER